MLIWLAARFPNLMAFGLGAVFLTVALVLLVLGCVSPTSSSEVHTPMEKAAVAFAACHAEHQELGREIAVVFHDSKRGDGAVAWAWPGGNMVNLVRPWVNSTDLQQLELTVAHELCHVTGIWDEGQADFCAQLAYRDADCRQEGR